MLNRLTVAALAILLSVLVCGLTTELRAQDNEEPLTDQLHSLIKHEPFSVTGLVRSTARYSFEDNQFNGGRRFNVDHARLGIRGVLDENFDYRFQVDFGRQVSLLDAYIGYRFSEGMNIRVGAQKPNISAELIPSTGTTDFIDRARLTGAQLNSREFGVSLFGNPESFFYNVGLYNGTGLSGNVDNRFWVTARGGFDLLYEQEGSLDVAVNVAYGECFANACSPAGLQSAGSKVTFGGDFRYQNDRWLVAGELLGTRADVTNYFADEETVLGFYLTGGFKPGEQTMLLARWDHLGFREAESSNNMLLLGLNHQITSLVKFQFNLLTLFEPDSDDQMGVSANLQLLF